MSLIKDLSQSLVKDLNKIYHLAKLGTCVFHTNNPYFHNRIAFEKNTYTLNQPLIKMFTAIHLQPHYSNTFSYLNISSKHYTTSHHKQSDSNKKDTEKDNKTKSQSKKKVSFVRGAIGSLLLLGGSFFIYNVYLYYTNNQTSQLKSCYCQHFISELHMDTKTIIDYLTLPYNSFVLIDKLQPVSKGLEKTLVLNLNKTLVTYTYSIIDGFEVLARPGLVKFIQELGRIYEIVIFSNEDSGFIEEIAKQIDPKSEYIRFTLGKEATRLYKRRPIKDLNYLNRNLDNVIVVDSDPENVLLHQSNSVIIPEFNGNGKDRELLLMIVFLKDMASDKIKNIRTEFEKYGHYKPYLKYYASVPKYHRLLPKKEASI